MLDGNGFLSKVNSTKLGDRINIDGESAYLLIDTRKYSQFSVSRFESTQVFGTGSSENPSVPASLMKMTVVDSTGLTFFNFLMHTMKNRIQSTRSSAFFMLSIVFVGHNDTYPQQTETIATCHIPMLLVNLGFKFDSTGSIYDMEFVETEGNPGQSIPQMVELGDIQAVGTEGKANTIGGMIQALEDRLNLNSVRFYHKYTNTALQNEGDSGPIVIPPTASERQRERLFARARFAQAGKLVQYMITIPKEWENFAINTAGKSRNVEQVYLAKTKEQREQLRTAGEAAVAAAQSSGDTAAVDAAIKSRDSYTSFSYTTSIQDAIKIILESSQQYLDLASTEKRRKGDAVVHKTVANITSDDTTYVLHYDVYPYNAPKMEADRNGVEVSTKPELKMSSGQIRNLLTYDYVFSGRNSHILDLKIEFSPQAGAAGLDVDLNMGQNRFAENSGAGQNFQWVDDASSYGQNESKDFNPLMRPGEPVFIPVKTREQQLNWSTQNTEELKKAQALNVLKSKQEHTSTLAVLHFLGSLDAQMTIRGNPNLFRKYADRNTRGGIPRHSLTMKVDDLKDVAANYAETFFNNSVKGKVSSGKQEYFNSYVLPRHTINQNGNTDAILHGGDIASHPMFAKINIYAPNVDFLGNTIPGNAAFTNRFFYNGVYLVAFITHIFDNGSFTQVLSLMPYDIDGAFSKSIQTNRGAQTSNSKES